VLSNARSCSSDEIRAQAEYLAATPVSTIADALRSGQARLSTATFRSLADLGSLETIFGTLGQFRPPAGQHRFKVSQILPCLKASDDADPKMRADITGFMASDANGAVEYNVTLVRSQAGLVLADGNKRSVAFFERRRGSEAPIDFKVFVVDGIDLGA
jgi:hypothetical protein